MPIVNRKKPRLIRVTGKVYSATGYAISNVLYIITDRSVVIVDTTESVACARASLAKFREICSLPISYIIFTHYHGDHIKGAKAFYSDDTKVIAHSRLEQERAQNFVLGGYRLRADILQFGLSLPLSQRGVTHYAEYGLRGCTAWNPNANNDVNYIAPNITFDEKYHFHEGGTDFELYHTEGETYDHLMIWLPGEEVLFPGDLFYRYFPMLNNPLKPARPILSWALSLERMRRLKPKFLAPSHGPPLSGAEVIDATLANYAEAIRYVHDETIKRMNRGELLEQISREVRLPERLAQLPYLREEYGTVRWTVRGVFLEYAGWYSWHPTDLNPCARSVFARALLQACGSARPLLRRARRALDAGNSQLALELAAVVLDARPRNEVARGLYVQALRTLAANTANRVERNIYLAAVTQTWTPAQ